MKNELLRLSDQELKWIQGRISSLDVQEGCPVQCITCGVDAKKYSFNMPWNTLTELSDSILEIKTTKHIDLFNKANNADNKKKSKTIMCPFISSDPIYYRSFDRNKERTISDVVNLLANKHQLDIYITTAGWRPGNNYMQKTAQKIARAKRRHNKNIKIFYSVKTVGEKTIKEYISIKKNSKNEKDAIQQFIETSTYVHNLTENMRLLKGVEACYSLQSIDIRDLEHFFYNPIHNLLNGKFRWHSNKQYKDIKELFSNKTIDKIFNYSAKKAGLDQVKYEYKKHRIDYRTFYGVGRAKNLNLRTGYNPYKKKLQQKPGKRELLDEEFFVDITARGILKIYAGKMTTLNRELVSKKYFKSRVDFYKNRDAKKSAYYTMLLNLQGKKLV